MKGTSTDKDRGKRIHYVRTGILNLRSQLAFAEFLGGVSRGAVGNWERGLDISLDNLTLITNKAKVPFDWLAFGRGEAPVAPGAGPGPAMDGKLEQVLAIFDELPEPVQKEFLRRALGLEDLGRFSSTGSAASTKDDESPR